MREIFKKSSLKSNYNDMLKDFNFDKDFYKIFNLYLMFHDQVINPNSSVKMILFPKMQTFAFFW